MFHYFSREENKTNLICCQGEYEAAFDLFDERIAKIAKENQGALLDIIDASSLLFRLELEGWSVNFNFCLKFLFRQSLKT